jgi:putative membrane protein
MLSRTCPPFRERTSLQCLCVVFLTFCAVTAIHPVRAPLWGWGNVPVVGLLGLLALTFRRYPLSDLAYTGIALFIALHEIGSHYTYDLVPFHAALKQLFSPGRNSFDRVVHFAFGFFIGYAAHEAQVRYLKTPRWFSFLFPVTLVLSISAVYEIAEGPYLPHAIAQQFLGVDDPWDTQLDMAAAGYGVLVCLGLVVCASARQRLYSRSRIAIGRWRTKRPEISQPPALAIQTPLATAVATDIELNPPETPARN